MKKWLITGAASALLSVILGAFAAHGLRQMLDPAAMGVFETGVRYQMYHALAILLLPGLAGYAARRWLYRAAGLFVAGTLLFSGSLYLLTLTQITAFGPVTPLGGLCFMAGWGSLVIGLFKGESA